MKEYLKDLAAYIAPCAIVGFFLGAIQLNIWFSVFLCFCAQYFFKKTDIGTLLGLSTFFYGPIAFIAYACGMALFAK